jgi:citrate lyase alpha subunit
LEIHTKIGNAERDAIRKSGNTMGHTVGFTIEHTHGDTIEKSLFGMISDMLLEIPLKT